MGTAEYDAIADLFAARVAEPSDYNDRVHDMLRTLLGSGDGSGDGSVCLDICCGMGARAPMLRELGWRPIGADISTGQRARRCELSPSTRA